VLAGALAPASASASIAVGPETRVRGFGLQDGAHVGAEGLASRTSRQAYELVYDGIAVGSLVAPSRGVGIATSGQAGAAGEVTPLLQRIREGGGTLPIKRGEVTAREVAAASRAGNEVALFRDRATGQLYLRELGPIGGDVPPGSRLILHSHPGEGALAVVPSGADRLALKELGQRSSVIIDSKATHSMRFRRTNATDEPIRPLP
jgi:hypothetical protein